MLNSVCKLSVTDISLRLQRWGISKFVESYIKWKLPLKKYGMVPKHGFHQQISSCKTVLLPDKFYDKVEEGSIILKKMKNLSFCRNGLILDNQELPVESDLVIFATGYKSDQKLKNLFTSLTFQKCLGDSSSSTIPLYRWVHFYIMSLH